MKLLVLHAWILTMDNSMRVLKDGWMLCTDDTITAIGEGECSLSADTIIDAKGAILFPGFVNTHCHISMMPFRSLGDDCPDRLRRFLFPLENEAMTEDLVYHAARYGMAELLLGGVTTFVDMYYFEVKVAQACREMGLRGYLGETIIGQTTCDSPEAPYGGFAFAERQLEAWKDDSRIHPILAPHGTTTCSGEALVKAHALAKKYDTLITLHASEMDYEMAYFSEQGTTPIAYMDRLGILDNHMLAAHCIHLSGEDIMRMATAGVGVAHCVGSNTKAGKGIAPVKELIAAGVAVSLGTDGASSGNTLSMFDQMRLFADCHKTKNHDRALFPADRILYAATRGGAAALHGEQDYGFLAVGMKADFVIMNMEAVNMFPVHDPYSVLVYSANAGNVDTVCADGHILVKNGMLTQMPLQSLRKALTDSMQDFTAIARECAGALL